MLKVEYVGNMILQSLACYMSCHFFSKAFNEKHVIRRAFIYSLQIFSKTINNINLRVYHLYLKKNYNKSLSYKWCMLKQAYILYQLAYCFYSFWPNMITWDTIKYSINCKIVC